MRCRREGCSILSIIKSEVLSLDVTLFLPSDLKALVQVRDTPGRDQTHDLLAVRRQVEPLRHHAAIASTIKKKNHSLKRSRLPDSFESHIRFSKQVHLLNFLSSSLTK